MAEKTQSPGWYPDPDGGGRERWWDGVSWSDTRRGANSTTASPVAPAIPPAAYSAKHRALPWESTSVNQVWLRINRFAIIGLILGFLSVTVQTKLSLPLFAILVSVIGLIKLRQFRDAGPIWNGLIFSIIGLVLGIFAALRPMIESLLGLG